jgi:hypothetical protein
VAKQSRNKQLAEDVMSVIESFHKKHRNNAHRIVGGEKEWFNIEFLALLYWITTFRFSTFAKNRQMKALLNDVHAGLFAVLVGLGTNESDAEAYVQERYANYYDAIKTRDDSAEGLSHVAACFIGFCNDRDAYSLQLNKVTKTFQLIADFLRVLNKELE